MCRDKVPAFWGPTSRQVCEGSLYLRCLQVLTVKVTLHFALSSTYSTAGGSPLEVPRTASRESDQEEATSLILNCRWQQPPVMPLQSLIQNSSVLPNWRRPVGRLLADADARWCPRPLCSRCNLAHILILPYQRLRTAIQAHWLSILFLIFEDQSDRPHAVSVSSS